MPPALAADLVLLAHLAFICWVVGGLVLIVAARPLGWAWARNPWLRVVHLASIGVVTAEAWLGIPCPLTTWENRLRAAAGQDLRDPDGLVAGLVRPLVFFDLPAAWFTWAYTGFALLVLASFLITPVRWRRPRGGPPRVGD